MVTNLRWYEFVVATGGCILGITFLSAALSNYFLTRMQMWERLVCAFAAVLMITPSMIATSVGIAMVIPVIGRQLVAARRLRSA